MAKPKINSEIKIFKKDYKNPTTSLINFESLAGKINEKYESISKNPNYSKVTAESLLKLCTKLNTIKRKNIITIDLEIPKELVNELKSGKLFRLNGSIRKNGSSQFVKHLNEVKPSNVKKITKIANLAFVAYDLLESFVLDEKLKEILSLIKSVDQKIEAQNKGKLLSAINQMKEIKQIKNEEIRKQKILILQNEFSYCEHLYKELLDNSWNDYKLEIEKYDNSMFKNKKEIDEIRRLGQQIPDNLLPIIICKTGMKETFSMLGEFDVAFQKSIELSDFLSDNIQRYKEAFSPEALNVKKNTYKNYFFQDPDEKFKEINEELIEPNEKFEFILNSTLIHTLSTPEYIQTSENELSIDSIEEASFLEKKSVWEIVSNIFKKIWLKVRSVFH